MRIMGTGRRAQSAKSRAVDARRMGIPQAPAWLRRDLLDGGASWERDAERKAQSLEGWCAASD